MSQFTLEWGPSIKTVPPFTIVNGELVIEEGARFEIETEQDQPPSCREVNGLHRLSAMLEEKYPNKD